MVQNGNCGAHLIRHAICNAFCGKLMEEDNCPAKCPGRKRNLHEGNWGDIRIRDIVGPKKRKGAKR